MKIILLLLLIIILQFTFASENPNSNKILYLKKVDVEIKIDGIIDDIWNVADSTDDFFQLLPYYDQPVSRRTVAKVLTTDEAIYCLIICYDDKEKIQTSTGLHDQFGGDIVSFMIDTFGDKQSAYKFGVAASGVKMDSRLLDDGRNRDFNWDGIWFADAKVYDWGYVVEMEIPYKSIKYDKTLTEWGVDFDRWIPWLTEDQYWCRYEKNEGQRVSKFGRLVFSDFKPTITGLNLEIYPVGISKITYIDDGKYKFDPEAGLDIFFNPSQQLTFQLTANPDFAQIEADPFSFNISRYESYFSERRPFFTEGNEIFMPAGRQRGSGFYQPLELMYTRRIGKLLPDGSQVPLIVGTKAFGRQDDWEYGGFYALTGKTNYKIDNEDKTEPQASFVSGRIKKTILSNSNIGMLFVGKITEGNTYGVIDIDGAFRTSDWQLAYQVARSIENDKGDYAFSAGFTSFGERWITLARTRYIGNDFEINQVGFVPWKGTGTLTAITGPIWYFDDGLIRSTMLYGGLYLGYEKADDYTDRSGVLGLNVQFRNQWGFETNISAGKSRDEDVTYDSYELTFSSWFDISPRWGANLYGGYSKTYNFRRDYLGYYSWVGASGSYRIIDELQIGTNYRMFIEIDPERNVEDITFNARPYFSLTPVNDLNLRMYVDNVFIRSTDKMQSIIVGFLFSWNFLPKSWIYFAYNEFRDRSDEYDMNNNILPNRLHVTDRAGVFKIKYLYYF